MTTVDDAGFIAVRMTRRVKRGEGGLEMSIVGEEVTRLPKQSSTR
jgi:hypothetical protein